MADWFVDQGIVAGNGTDPASAFASILSVAWASGDRAWVRNTHFETITNSQILGQNTPSVAGFSRWHFAIGWPGVGDPFYDERPARGVTVGWDSDVASSTAQNTFGFNHPTFLNSNGGNGAGMLFGYQMTLANFCFCTSPGLTTIAPWNNTFGILSDRIVDNALVLCTANGQGNGMGNKQWNFMGGRIIVTNSAGSNPSAAILNGAICARVIEVHSRAGINNGLFNPTASLNIGMVINWSTSIPFLFDNNNGGTLEQNTTLLAQTYVGRIVGIKPYSGYTAGEVNLTPALRIDDYFGEGPIQPGDHLTANMRVASSGEAQHNALPAVFYSVGSGTFFGLRGFWDARWRNPSMRKYFSVVSGTNVAIYVPVYIDSTATYSAACGQMRSYLQCKGAAGNACVRSTLIPGSYTNWTGSLIAGGSAWLWVSTFTPKETGTFAFDIHFANHFQTNSGDVKKCYTLFGEPYAV
jgi:hypothetical protein